MSLSVEPTHHKLSHSELELLAENRLRLEEARQRALEHLRSQPKEIPELMQDGSSSVSYVHPALFVHGKLLYDGGYPKRRREMERQGEIQYIPVFIRHWKRVGVKHTYCGACDVMPFVPIKSISNRKNYVNSTSIHTK